MASMDSAPACCAPARAGADAGRHQASGNVVRKRTDAREMADIPSGAFLMGSDDRDARQEDGEGPVREVSVDAFAIERTAVTNAQFQSFVAATGYRTEAESYGWAYVFSGLLPKSRRHRLERSSEVGAAPWWLAVEGASWRKPEGPGSNLKGRLHHPVVQVSWHDAVAYCDWADMRLPTEAEWEYAARGGLVGKRFPWGDELVVRGKHRCNIWQGSFPHRNDAEDGYLGTAPAKAFAANGFGLYNVVGNVWEWCSDWFSADPHRNPSGPGEGTAKVLKGGSYLCHDSYCNRYRVAARYANTPDSATGNMGFRCVEAAPTG